jgi:hypothetical protein
MTCLQVVRECVRAVLEAAEDVCAYLARSKDDWSQMHSFQQLSEHLNIFPDLELNDLFCQRLQDSLDLPLTAGGIAAGEPLHAVAIKDDNVQVFRLLHQHAQRLHGLAAPVFVVSQGKVLARYDYEGLLSLNDFSKNYEITSEYLNTLFASVTAAAAAFQHHVGRQHGAAEADNIFVDVIAGGRVILGAHAPRPDKADVPTLTETVGQLALARGLPFTPHKPLFKLSVDCDFCSERCARSFICPGDGHKFCEECMENLMNSQTKQSGSMPHLSCPMPGCGAVWSDVDLLKMLPGPQAEQAHKRRKVHLETELRTAIRSEIQAELAAAPRATAVADGELRQSLVAEALNLLVDQCRFCGLAFFDFDGCFAIGCECGRSICGYCLASGTSAQIHVHIASNDCGVRRQMFPDAQEHTFQQGADQKVEFGMARRLRIHAELTNLFETLGSRDRTLLARRILQDVTENGVDLTLVVPVIEELQERG